MSNSSVSEKSRSIFDGLKSFKQENSDALLIVALMGTSYSINKPVTNQHDDIKSPHEKGGLPLINRILRKQFISRHFIRKEKAKEAEDIDSSNSTMLSKNYVANSLIIN
jgi:hypothetical protein